MRILDALRARLSDRAPVGAGPGQGPRSIPPAAPVGPGKPRQLQFANFSANAAWSSNMPIVLAQYEVPLGEVFKPDPLAPIRCYLMARHETAITADAAVTLAVDLGAAGYDLVRSNRVAPALPSLNHPDARAFISSDNGGTWTESNVTAFDETTNTVTIAKVAATNRIKVYFLHGNGEFRLRVSRPAGSDVVSPLIYNSPFKALHETNQIDGRTAIRLSGARSGDFPALAPRWKLALEVKTSAPMYWQSEARHELLIHGFTAPVLVHNWKLLEARLEQEWRSGL